MGRKSRRKTVVNPSGVCEDCGGEAIGQWRCDPCFKEHVGARGACSGCGNEIVDPDADHCGPMCRADIRGDL